MAVIAAVRVRDSRLSSALVIVSWMPFAIVVGASSISGAHQFALAVGLIGYALSKSNRRVADTIAERAIISTDPDCASQTRSSEVEIGRSVLVPSATVCVAIVALFFVAQWSSAQLGIEGRWMELTAVASGTGIAIAYWNTRVSLKRAATHALLIATVATVFASALVIGSWTITSSQSPDPVSFLDPWPKFIYIQALMAALLGAVIMLWAAAKRTLGGYCAMSMGFMWPLVLAYLLNAHRDREMEWLWQLGDWILVPVFAIGMVTAMWVANNISRPRGAHCDDASGM